MMDAHHLATSFPVVKRTTFRIVEPKLTINRYAVRVELHLLRMDEAE